MSSKAFQAMTPLNMPALAGICYLIFNDIAVNYALAPIFPQMVGDFIENPDDVGFYVGLLTSIYFGVQFFSSLWWGKASDQYGRRRTLYWGLFGNGIGLLIFGFSTSYLWAVIGRTISGCLNGLGTIAKTYLGELTDETNAHAAFGKMGMAYGLALIIGPVLGGYLCDPASIWDSFDNVFWWTYPYLFAILILLLFTVVALWILILILNESKPWVAAQQKAEQESHGDYHLQESEENENGQFDTKSNDITYGAVDGAEEDEYELGQGDMEEYFDFPIQALNDYIPHRARVKLIFYAILVFCLNVIMYMSYDVMIGVYMEAPREGGGLGFSTGTAGLFMGLLGVFMLIWNRFFYRKVGAKLGTKMTIVYGLMLFMILYILFPFVTLIDQTCDVSVTYFALAIMQCLRAIAGSSSTMATQVLITQTTPPKILGQVNGYSNSLTAIAKVVGPLFAGALWSALQGSDESPFWKVAWTYWTFALIGLVPIYAAKRVPDNFTVQTGRIKK